MLPSSSLASTAGATVSAWGTGADSSAAGVEPSSATAALGSFSSQDKSVDFLHKYTIGCQPSMTTQLHVLLGEDLHLQARSDYCHGWGTKYAGDVNKPSFGRRLFFGLSCRWVFSSRSCGRFRPVSDDRRLRLDYRCRLMCQLRHELFHCGGWIAASSSRLPHCLPVAFIPLVYRVGRRNPASNGILLSAYTTLKDKYSTTLLEEFTS
jgi:hypothetical protein